MCLMSLLSHCMTLLRPSTTQADDTRLQDQDKMITYDTARVQYSSYRLFLAVDSDELLVPDPQSPLFKQFQLKHSKHSSPSSYFKGSLTQNIANSLFKQEYGAGSQLSYPPVGFKAYIAKVLSMEALSDTEEFMLFRYSAAATTPSGLVHPKKISEDGDMVAHTSACLLAGDAIGESCSAL